MNHSGDSAEQVVRLSLEGMEVAVKITGTATKHLVAILLSILKQEHKTRGKARLTSMIKSGKELKVFAVQNKDLATFTAHAKQYGVLYCVIRDKENDTPNAVVDIIARAEDAPKIQRIFDRYGIGKVELTTNTEEVQKTEVKEQGVKETVTAEVESKDPFTKRPTNEVPFDESLKNVSMQGRTKQSVREKLNTIKDRARQNTPKEHKKEVPHHEVAGR